MNRNPEDRERQFLRERIVPRRRKKKILLMILAAVGLGIVFGAVSGVVYYLVSDSLQGLNPAEPPQIIIVRDEEGSEESEPTENTTDTAEESVKPAAREDDFPVEEVYEKIRNGIVGVRVVRTEVTDLIESRNVTISETFGAVIAETPTTVMILTDGDLIREDDKLVVSINDQAVYADIVSMDQRGKLCVIKIRKNLLTNPVTVLPLGNSFMLNELDHILMVGAPLGIQGSAQLGRITNIVSSEGIIDGYRQRVFTDMAAIPGGSAVLIDRNGRIVGWVSGNTILADGHVAAAAGISPMKYILEDLLSARDTAFLGVTCSELSAVDEVLTGSARGVYVHEVEEGSPAFVSGIRVGDRIQSINGRSVATNYQLLKSIDELKPGEEAVVEVERHTFRGRTVYSFNVVMGHR